MWDFNLALKVSKVSSYERSSSWTRHIKTAWAHFHCSWPWHHKVTASGRPMASEIWLVGNRRHWFDQVGRSIAAKTLEDEDAEFELWSRSFGELGASGGYPACLRWSGRTSVFPWQDKPPNAVPTPACSTVPCWCRQAGYCSSPACLWQRRGPRLHTFSLRESFEWRGAGEAGSTMNDTPVARGHTSTADRRSTLQGRSQRTGSTVCCQQELWSRP